jgi:hypothetical protein
MKLIPLSQGKVAMVDDADFDNLAQYKWYVRSKNDDYAVRNLPNRGGQVSMHRELMAAPGGLVIDHIDGNGLNNQRANLRLCTVSQNQWNRRRDKRNKTGRTGVWQSNVDGTYRARIHRNGTAINLGTFETPIEADSARIWGEFLYHKNFGAARTSECR